MAVEVGDAVFKFLGNTTNLDAAFDSIGPKTTAAFGPATKAADGFGDALEETGSKANKAADEVEEASQRSNTAVREARGEVALLGEEFGIHLPRHVRSFVAEMPGVGEALSAAFSATAILFVAQAIVQVTQKLSALTADFLIFTDEMKASNSEVARHNQALLALKDTFDKDSEALEKFGKTALEVAAMKVGKLTKALEESKAAALSLKEEAGSVELQYSKWGMAVDALTTRLGFGSIMFNKAITQQANAVAEAQDRADEAVKNSANKEKELALAKKERDAEALKEFQKHIQALNEADTARTELFHRNEEAQNEADNARTALALANTQKRVKAIQLENEADAARAELFHKQEELENEAENARAKMAADKLKLESEAEDARAKLYAREKKELDDLKKQTSVTFQSFAQQWMKAAAPLRQLGAEGQEAFNKLTSGLETAVAASLLSQQSFGAAMEQMTRQVLASLASQALVKALFYTAEGTAALFTDPPAAGAFFTAAAEMGAVGAAAGVVARAIPGGGGSGSSSTQQGGTSSSSTGSQAGRSGGSTVGIQHFATGGFIDGPTLAMVGEMGRKEAVLPLEDPRAMSEIAKAINGGGGGNIHVHVAGLISPDNLTKVVKKISDRVNRGQLHLQASNSLRITKRSA